MVNHVTRAVPPDAVCSLCRQPLSYHALLHPGPGGELYNCPQGAGYFTMSNPIPAVAGLSLLVRRALEDQLSEEEVLNWADCRLTRVNVGQSLRAAQSVVETLRPYLSHDRECLSRKGAHYGAESCDCGLTYLLRLAGE